VSKEVAQFWIPTICLQALGRVSLDGPRARVGKSWEVIETVSLPMFWHELHVFGLSLADEDLGYFPVHLIRAK
jgi:hypothetical protein